MKYKVLGVVFGTFAAANLLFEKGLKCAVGDGGAWQAGGDRGRAGPASVADLNPPMLYSVSWSSKGLARMKSKKPFNFAIISVCGFVFHPFPQKIVNTSTAFSSGPLR